MASNTAAALTANGTTKNSTVGSSSPEKEQTQQHDDESDGGVVVVIGRTRVRDRKQPFDVGTVAYRGPVAGYAGEYWGVVWDDVSRGKHDGSVVDKTSGEFRRYFRTPNNHPTAGSFVRPKLLDTGRPLSKAVLLERYRNRTNEEEEDGEEGGDTTKDEDEQQEQQHVVSTVSGKTKPIEVVGTQKILKQQRWHKLHHMSLRGMGISGMVSPSTRNKEFADVQHLVHLDLAGNLFGDWTVLPQLLEAFPNLTHLSLAKNRMDDDTTTSSSCCCYESEPTTIFSSKLTYLNLRDCNIQSFATVAAIVRRLPNLQELCCAYSDLSDVVDFVAGASETEEPLLLMSNLVSLDVTRSGLGTADQLRALASQCPNLQSLSLNDNPLSSWPTTTSTNNGTGTCCWPGLQELQLDNTEFRDWESLRPLLELHQLRALRFSSPLLTAGPNNNNSNKASRSSNSAAKTRVHWIAAFPRLQQYQSSTINDRKEMEQQYVLQAAVVSSQPEHQQQDQPEQTQLEGLLRPQDARYQDLMKTYAELVERRRSNAAGEGGSAAGGGGDGLFLSMVTVRILSFCPSSCTMPPLVRKLPLRLTVSRLKALCARHFDLDADLQHLQWKSSDDRNAFPVDLVDGGGDDDSNDDEITLRDCGIVDGAEILVKERELPSSQSNETTTKSSSQQQQQQRQENSKQALLERIRQQEQERFDLDKRKAAAAAGGGGRSSTSSGGLAVRLATTTIAATAAAPSSTATTNPDQTTTTTNGQ